MIIGSISENKNLEKRISITPDLVKKYTSKGFKILIEKDYGTHLGIFDEQFNSQGCEIENRNNIIERSNVLLQLDIPNQESLDKIQSNKILIGNFNFYENDENLKNLAKKKYKYFLFRTSSKDH